MIFLGDIIDGGENANKCIEKILSIRDAMGINVVAKKGNHEEWFLNTMENCTKHSWIISMEGLHIIKSYSETAYNEIITAAKEIGPTLITEYKPLPYDKFFEKVPERHIEFIKSMKNYYKVGHYIFTHAGINPEIEDLSKMEENKFRWGFEGFPEKYNGKNVVVYGHFSKKAK